MPEPLTDADLGYRPSPRPSHTRPITDPPTDLPALFLELMEFAPADRKADYRERFQAAFHEWSLFILASRAS